MYVKFNEPWNFHSESLIWKSPVNYEMGVIKNSLYGNGMYQLGFGLVGNGGFTRRIMSYSEISTWFHVTGTYDQGHLVQMNGVEVDDDYGATSIPDQDAILYLGGALIL